MSKKGPRWGKKKTVYELIEDDYSDDSNERFPKEFLTKFRTQYNFSQLFPHKDKKKIQKVSLEYVLSSQIDVIKTEFIVVVHISSKAKQKQIQVINLIKINKEKKSDSKQNSYKFKFECQTERFKKWFLLLITVLRRISWKDKRNDLISCIDKMYLVKII